MPTHALSNAGIDGGGGGDFTSYRFWILGSHRAHPGGKVYVDIRLQNLDNSSGAMTCTRSITGLPGGYAAVTWRDGFDPDNSGDSFRTESSFVDSWVKLEIPVPADPTRQTENFTITITGSHPIDGAYTHNIAYDLIVEDVPTLATAHISRTARSTDANNMVQALKDFGSSHGWAADIAAKGTGETGATFYDGQAGLFIMDAIHGDVHTADNVARATKVIANDLASTYYDEYIQSFIGVGHRQFVLGSYFDWLINATSGARTSIIGRATNSSSAASAAGASCTLIRENAYALRFYLYCNLVAPGTVSAQKIDMTYRQLLGHIDQMHMSAVHPWNQPFFTALAVEALWHLFHIGSNSDGAGATDAQKDEIKYYVKSAIDAIDTESWIAASDAYLQMNNVFEPYPTPTDSGGEWQAIWAAPVVAAGFPIGTPPRQAAPSLSGFMAFVLGWVWNFTGDATYKSRAEEMTPVVVTSVNDYAGSALWGSPTGAVAGGRVTGDGAKAYAQACLYWQLALWYLHDTRLNQTIDFYWKVGA